MQRTLQPHIRQKVKQRDRRYRSARLERTGLKGLFQYRTAARRAFSANFPITQGDAVFKSRVHAAAACVLPSRAVQGRPGAPVTRHDSRS